MFVNYQSKIKICVVLKPLHTVTLGFVTVWLTACSAAQSDIQQASLSQGASLSASCSGCHIGEDSIVPSLQVWTQTDLATALYRYQSDGDSVMHRYARGLSQSDIEQIAAYLGD